MPLDVDPFDDEDMYSVDYNDEAISIGSDSDHFMSERSDSDDSDLGGSNSDGEAQHLSEIMVCMSLEMYLLVTLCSK